MKILNGIQIVCINGKIYVNYNGLPCPFVEFLEKHLPEAFPLLKNEED